MAKKNKAFQDTGTYLDPELQQDEALFEALGKSKKRKKRKILMIVLSIVPGRLAFVLREYWCLRRFSFSSAGSNRQHRYHPGP